MFNNDYIQINDNGIDLLRNRYPYLHIDYSNVDNYKITDGYLLRNRFIILVFGMGLIFFSLKLAVHQLPLYKDIFGLTNHGSGSFKGLGFILLAAPMMMVYGIFLTWQSFVTSKILQLFTDSKTYNIRIREIDKKGNLMYLISYLDDKIINK